MTQQTATDWNAFLNELATTLGKSSEDIANALKPIVGENPEQAILYIKDAGATPDDMVREALGTLGAIPAAVNVAMRKIATMRGPAPAEMQPMPALDVLPTVLDDEAFTEVLRVGGVLEVDATAVHAAVKAAIADRLGYFRIPGTLKQRMRQYYLRQRKPFPKDSKFTEIQKLLNARRYAPILAAAGLAGHSITKASKRDLLERIGGDLWKALRKLQAVIDQYVKDGRVQLITLGVGGFAYIQNQGGMRRNALVDTLLMPEDPSNIRTEVESVITEVNSAFAADGIPTAWALASDAGEIRKLLKDPQIAVQCGYPSTEQMLTELGLAVKTDVTRMEKLIARYVFSAIKYPTGAALEEEIAYIVGLYNLGKVLPWDQILKNGVAGAGLEDEDEMYDRCIHGDDEETAR